MPVLQNSGFWQGMCVGCRKILSKFNCMRDMCATCCVATRLAAQRDGVLFAECEAHPKYLNMHVHMHMHALALGRGHVYAPIAELK